MRLIDADAFDEWLQKHEEAAALLEAADSDVFVDKDRKTYYSTQSFRDVMRYRPTIKINDKESDTEMMPTTYSNTICPKCHSTEVVWNFNSMKDPALECMKCHHKFDPPIYQPTSKYKIITLCGSTRFRDTFLWIQKELTLAGYIVISVGCFGHYENESEQKRIEEKKTMLDDMHKCKIDMADAIFVINQDNYIGKSTESEIKYACEHHKEIYYLIPPREEKINAYYS